MSWNVSLTDIEPVVHEIEAAAEGAYRDFKANYSDAAEVFPAMDEQFDAALEAARVLLMGGVERRPVVGESNVNVTLSGHANPSHRPRQGWANDMVTVTVSSAARAEAPA